MPVRTCCRCDKPPCKGQGYCAECREKYNAERQKIKLHQSRLAGYHEGAAAMRVAIVQEFSRYGAATLSCEEFSLAVKSMLTPKPA